MTKFEFTIEKSKFQEAKFLESLKNYLKSNKVKNQDAILRTGTKKTRVFGLGTYERIKEDTYQDTKNPFYFSFGITKFNIFGDYIGEIKVDNIKVSNEIVENENLIINTYLLKGVLGFKPKKLIPILIIIIGFFIAIGNGFAIGTIFNVLLVIIFWNILLRIIGLIIKKKAIAKFENIISNYVDVQ